MLNAKWVDKIREDAPEYCRKTGVTPLTALIFALIIAFAVTVRVNTFWVSHWGGDEGHYLGLAMKLDKGGLGEYNIRGIDVSLVPLSKTSMIAIIFPRPAAPGDKGEMLKGHIQVGLDYYDIPLFQNAPAFPYLLTLTHRLFCAPDQPYSVIQTFGEENYGLVKMRPFAILQIQFYAAIVPFLFSILTIFLIAFFALFIFRSARIALYAAFIYAADPVGIFTSQRIWADDMLTFFLTASWTTFFFAYLHKNRAGAFAAGILSGIGLLAKQTGLIALPVIAVFTFLITRTGRPAARSLKNIVTDKYLLLFFGGAVVVSAWWFIKVYEVYGTPFFASERDLAAIAAKDLAGWHKMVASRPHPYILYSIGVLYLQPLFLFGIFSIGYFLRSVRNRAGEVLENRPAVLLMWTWIILFYIASAVIGKEHRYMLPLHPPLAILSAFMLDRFRINIKDLKAAEITVIIILIAAACWSVPIGTNAVLGNKTIIRVPF